MSDIAESVWQTLRSLYLEHNEYLDEVSVESLAREAIKQLEPKHLASPSTTWAALQHLKQMARQLCRHLNITEAQARRQALQGELFSDRLQDRYPVRRQGDDAYIRRELLSLKERVSIIEKLRKGSMGMMDHARALEQETLEMQAQGKLPTDPEEVT